MKEIIRIHIAKIPYDIELDAKRMIEKYLHDIEHYADSEVLEDIEIRVTELLADKGIGANDIITKASVEEIMAQLGDPKEFLEDGDIAVGVVDEQLTEKPRHRLYRDPSSAVLGGVLAGLARYLDANPLWTRLAFLVLVFVSFGTAIILYVIAWIIVPPVRTTADRLELEGKPVTLTSIRDMSEKDDSIEDSSTLSRVLQRLFLYGCGVVFSALTLGALAATVFFGLLTPLGAVHSASFVSTFTATQGGIIAYVLFVIGGILSVIAGAAIAYSFFARRIARRIVITIVSAIIGVVITLSGGLGLLWYGNWQEQAKVLQSVTTKTVALGDSLDKVEKIIVNTNTVNDGWGDYSSIGVEYHAGSTNQRYEFTGLPGPQPLIQYSDDGKVATISFYSKDQRAYRYVKTALRIYGPAVKEVVVQGGALSYDNEEAQDTISLTTRGADSMLTLSGSYKNVSAELDAYSTIDATNAAIDTLSVHSSQHSAFYGGVVRSLDVTQPESCTDNGHQDVARVTISGVTSGTIRYNDHDMPARSIRKDCGNVILGRDKDY